MSNLTIPSIKLNRAHKDDFETLYNLAQLYQYDFTEFLPGEVDDYGEFPYLDVRSYLMNKDRYAYIAQSNHKLCGFSLVTEEMHHNDGPGRYLAEFWVMRRYRHEGVGRAMAIKTFDTFKGRWELAIVGPNTGGQAFWRKVVSEYTNARFKEFRVTEDDGLEIVWQTFDSSEW
jgi:predicted acetyltransferase